MNIKVIHLIDALSHVLEVGPIDFDLYADGFAGVVMEFVETLMQELSYLI